MNDILVSGKGQPDNLGDSVLRRGLLDALRRHGDLVVSVVDLPDAYLSGLGLQPQDTVVASRSDWQQRVARSCLSGCLYAFNAGEAQQTREYALAYLKMLPLLVVNRLRGGRAVHVGFGLRAPDRTWGRAMRPVLAACQEVAWRDADSRQWAGVGTVEPDWAYACGTPDDDAGRRPWAERDVLAVSLRFDRAAPGPVWFDVLRTVARDAGLRVVAVPQVERDIPRAREIAAELGGDVLEWDGHDHAVNEARVRAVYGESRLVVSDRLHAVIMGHTEGAVPIGFGTQSVSKLTRTLAPVGLRDVTFSQDDVDVAEGARRVHAALERHEEIVGYAAAARDRLDALAARLGAHAVAGTR
jgi:polysaccharide pyruvyl transferase WcaK-like protein